MHDSHRFALPAILLALVISTARPAAKPEAPAAPAAKAPVKTQATTAEVSEPSLDETTRSSPEPSEKSLQQTPAAEAKGFCSTLSPQLMRMTQDAWRRR